MQDAFEFLVHRKIVRKMSLLNLTVMLFYLQERDIESQIIEIKIIVRAIPKDAVKTQNKNTNILNEWITPNMQ